MENSSQERITAIGRLLYQAIGIERMLKKSGDKVLCGTAAGVLVDLARELRDQAPAPFSAVKRTEEEKVAYESAYRKIEELRRFLRNAPTYKGLGKILQGHGLQVSDLEIDRLISGVQITPQRISEMPSGEALAICQVLGIKLTTINKSFSFTKAKGGCLRPSHLEPHKKDAPNYFQDIDKDYGTRLAYIWENGYQSKKKLEEIAK